MNNYKVKYIRDIDVDEKLNLKLIDALTACFPDQPLFKKQRFYKELPQHRWFIEDGDKIIAHVAVHEKVISTKIGNIKIAGIAEVLVHPECRRMGLAKMVLDEAHSWSILQRFEYAMLYYGEQNVYKSSGYRVIDNPIKYVDHITNEQKIDTSPEVMIKTLSGSIWPEGTIDLNGSTF